MTATLSNAFTVDDLEAMPDDGKRHELIGGAIVMTPAPEPIHQRVSGEMFVLIREACPRGHQAFYSPIDFDLPGGQRVEPDIIVVPHSSVGEKRLSGPALLVVEIVSPGSAVNDRVTKREVYAQAGVPAYWIVDPREGRIVALRLVGTRYEVYADSDGTVALDWPVAVAFSVADLARPPTG